MKKTVNETMSTQIITIGWNERMETAWRRMQERRIRHLPVVNENGEAVGMLSDRDVQRAMISQLDPEVTQVISDETIEFDQNAHVRDYMSWPARTVEAGSDLRLVTERMISEKVSAFLVTHEGRVTGIVTSEDLLQVLSDLLADPKTPATRWPNLASLLETPFERRAALN